MWKVLILGLLVVRLIPGAADVIDGDASASCPMEAQDWNCFCDGVVLNHHTIGFFQIRQDCFGFGLRATGTCNCTRPKGNMRLEFGAFSNPEEGLPILCWKPDDFIVKFCHANPNNIDWMAPSAPHDIGWWAAPPDASFLIGGIGLCTKGPAPASGAFEHEEGSDCWCSIIWPIETNHWTWAALPFNPTIEACHEYCDETCMTITINDPDLRCHPFGLMRF